MSKFLNNIDINRTLFLFDYFYNETAEEIIDGLLELNQESKEDINIVINSWGGEVFSLFAILDTINNIESKVNTICLGEALSCGALLLASGTGRRYIGKNSRAMIHEVSAMSWGKVSQLEDELNKVKEVNEKVIDILATKTGKSSDYLKSIMKNEDIYLTSKESKEMGLVDEVIEDEDINTFNVDSSVYRYAASESKDKIIFRTLKNNKKGGEKKLSNIKVEDKKGDEVKLTKDEMINCLASEHGLDIMNLTNEVSSLKDTLKNVETQRAALEAEVNSIKAESRKKEITNLLDSLIAEGKSTQVLNESIYFDAFLAMGIEKATEVAAKMPVIAKFEQNSSSDNTEDTSDVVKEDIAIKALAKEKNISYVDAASLYQKKGA